MDEFAIECGDLTLTASQRVGGWISTIDGLGERRVAVKKDEQSAKDAGLAMAIAMLQRRGKSIPVCLTAPKWERREALEDRAG